MPFTVIKNGTQWQHADSTPNYQANYEDERWKMPSIAVLTQQDRENIRNLGLVREIPDSGNYYIGIEVKVSEEIF